MERQHHLSLTRELIEARFERPVADDETAMRMLSKEEIECSLHTTLGQLSGDLWLFAYGSLMWKPELEFVEQRPAAVWGYHRRFCLWQRRYRGTPQRPNLALALDRGGSCCGLIYRISPPDIATKVAAVWHREMQGNGYRPRWVQTHGDAGHVQAIAFVVNRETERYAGRLSDAVVADHIASANGHFGSGAEYLLETVLHLEELGIRDRVLWRLQELVAQRMIAAT